MGTIQHPMRRSTDGKDPFARYIQIKAGQHTLIMVDGFVGADSTANMRALSRAIDIAGMLKDLGEVQVTMPSGNYFQPEEGKNEDHNVR